MRDFCARVFPFFLGFCSDVKVPLRSRSGFNIPYLRFSFRGWVEPLPVPASWVPPEGARKRSWDGLMGTAGFPNLGRRPQKSPCLSLGSCNSLCSAPLLLPCPFPQGTPPFARKELGADPKPHESMKNLWEVQGPRSQSIHALWD